MAHESMTKQNSYKLYHDDIRNVLKGRSGGLPPRKTVDIPHFLLLEGKGVNEICIFQFSLANLRAQGSAMLFNRKIDGIQPKLRK